MLLTVVLTLTPFCCHCCRNPIRILLVFSSLNFFLNFATPFFGTLRFHSSQVLQITYSMAWLCYCLFHVLPIYQLNSSEASNMLKNLKEYSVEISSHCTASQCEISIATFHLLHAAQISFRTIPGAQQVIPRTNIAISKKLLPTYH